MKLWCVLLLTAPLSAQQATPPAVQQELGRLSACRPAFKTSPPPVHVRVVWTQPFDLQWETERSGGVAISFTIQYAQSQNYATQEQAEKAQDFQPVFNLRQRLHYRMEGDHLRLLWRESLIGSKWKRQGAASPAFRCWQSQM